MLKNLFRKPPHDCDSERRYNPSRNRAVVHFGVIWQCPDCHAFWYREIEYLRPTLGRSNHEPSVWRRLTKFQTYRLRRLTHQGFGQLEIAKRMRFVEPHYLGDAFDQSQKDGIEKYNQDPKQWVF